jgi:uncharacterized damage-inducible protein DinB
MFIAAKEDVLRAVEGLPASTVWDTEHGAASIGFHMLHLAGATDRLLSYAFGEELSESQKADLAAERTANEVRPSPDHLVRTFVDVMDASLQRLQGVSAEQLSTPRELGRAKVPTSMRALIVHAGEHAARHAGQIVTTARILRHRL